MRTTDETQSRREPTREPEHPSWDQPWRSQRPATDTAEGRAAALFREAAPPPPLSAHAHQRLRAQVLLAARTGGNRHSRHRAIARWRWAIVAALLFGSGAVIAAHRVDRWWRVVHGRASSPPAAQPPAAIRRAVGGVSRPPVVESKLALETRALSGAIIRLRRQGDAAGALAQLDEYLTRFPQGTLVTEAQGARVDALLLLDRHQEALAALKGLSLDDSGRDQELRIIRGELRSKVDCPHALADFDVVLRSPNDAQSALVERALHGSAACHLRTGQVVRAQQDADRYLRQFPQGRFAQEMRAVRAEGAARSGTGPASEGSGRL